MVTDQIQFDMADGDDGDFKSLFARSMAINSQYRENKCAAVSSGNKEHSHADCACASKEIAVVDAPAVIRHAKDVPNAKWSNNNNAEGSGAVKMREHPVENYLLHSQVNTLQWQLKEIESSREMYRALMGQVVTFLERAHRSLELLGSRIKSTPPRLSRPQSEYCITTSPDTTSCEVQWSWKKKQTLVPEEVPPEKLSQEAYRLLRMATSLLDTNEPDLVQVTNTKTSPHINDEDLSFLSQLAHEFPAMSENKPPQRTTSFSYCPKLLTPEREKEKPTTTTFNRKLSLQLNDTVRRNSFLREVSHLNRSMAIDQCAELISSTLLVEDKASSPPVSSVGSAEDESGFSSMNSFQEVGIPHSIPDEPPSFQHFADDLKLWQSPNMGVSKRWSANLAPSDKPPVLWV